MLNERETRFIRFIDETPLFDDEKKVLYDDNIGTLYHLAEDMVNNFGFHRDETAEYLVKDAHRRCVMLHIALAFAHYWGVEAKPWQTDERNEAATKICKAMTDTKGFQDLYEMFFNDGEFNRVDPGYKEVGILFAETTATMHKTLIQTFAGLVFKFITLLTFKEAFEINKEMEKAICREWWKLPLI